MLELDAVSLNGVATGTGTAYQLGGQCDGIRVYVQWAADVTAGVVKVEEAIETTYAGTWAEIAEVTSGTIGASGAVVTVAQAAGGVRAIRTRISTTVSGGGAPTVTTRIVAYSGAGA